MSVDVNVDHSLDELLHWDQMAIPVNRETLLDLSSFFGIEPDRCQERLDRYRLSEMAEEWRNANPKTAKEMRRFYEETELYVWELSKWHASQSYNEFKNRVARAMKLFPPTTHRRVLDYGAGIATAALEFARAGYEVTIADVPGKTQAFAMHRFQRRGLHCSVITVTKDIPDLHGEYDIVVSFDVLEHVPNAELVLGILASALRVGGAALINANFDDCGDHPQHLSSNRTRFNRLRWDWAIAGAGFRHLSSEVLTKAAAPWTLPRRLRWSVHRVLRDRLS